MFEKLFMKGNLPDKSHPPGILTLMYHRIDRADTNPWGICISPQNFEKQIRFLQVNFHVISVFDLCAQLTSGDIGSNNICITFDDGYRDNFVYAKPI